MTAAPERPDPFTAYWDDLIRDRAEEALAAADALDEQARQDRWMTAAREAQQVAARYGTGHWTGRTS